MTHRDAEYVWMILYLVYINNEVRNARDTNIVVTKVMVYNYTSP